MNENGSRASISRDTGRLRGNGKDDSEEEDDEVDPSVDELDEEDEDDDEDDEDEVESCVGEEMPDWSSRTGDSASCLNVRFMAGGEGAGCGA